MVNLQRIPWFINHPTHPTGEEGGTMGTGADPDFPTAGPDSVAEGIPDSVAQGIPDSVAQGIPDSVA